MKNTFNDLKSTLSESDIDQLVNLLGKRCRTKNLIKLRSVLTYGTHLIKFYGIFNRLVKETDGRWLYVAGQDYPSEIRLVRELIIK
jgi:hypothetical protein